MHTTRSFSVRKGIFVAILVYLFLLMASIAFSTYDLVRLRSEVLQMRLDNLDTRAAHLRRDATMFNLLTFGLFRNSAGWYLDQTAQITTAAATLSSSMEEVVKKTLSGDSNGVMIDLVTAQEQARRLQILLTQADDRLKHDQTITYFIDEHIVDQFNRGNTALTDLNALLDLLPKIIGPDEKHYIVLLQNNMELRATGGFLGSFAHITFRDNVIADLVVQDIYIPDGQLDGYVEPPQQVKQYLFQTGGWKLRDSNWDPHLPTTAPTIAWFFEQGGYNDVDGIVSLNLSLVQQLLSSIGPIYLADYNESVTAENFYATVQVETEESFFPGATNKTNILSALARTLIRQLQDLSRDKQVAVVQTLFESLYSRDLAFWFKEAGVQQFIAQHHWDGATQRVICEVTNCARDNLYIVESNVGVNKANCCVDRTVIYDIWITPGGSITTTATLQYLNNNPRTSVPPRRYGGGYENYLRFFKNQEAELESLTADQTLLPQSSISRFTWDELSVNEYGFLAQIGGGDTREFRARFIDDQRLDLSQPAQYRLMLQRQPGIQNDDYIVRFHYPSDLVSISTGSGTSAKIGDNELELLLDLNRSMTIDIALEPR